MCQLHGTRDKYWQIVNSRKVSCFMLASCAGSSIIDQLSVKKNMETHRISSFCSLRSRRQKSGVTNRRWDWHDKVMYKIAHCYIQIVLYIYARKDMCMYIYIVLYYTKLLHTRHTTPVDTIRITYNYIVYTYHQIPEILRTTVLFLDSGSHSFLRDRWPDW